MSIDKKGIKDSLVSKISPHILEEFPRFYDFLHAYYEWIGQDGNAYERIKNHMDYLSFKESLDAYTEHLKRDYLSDIPSDALLDKELFIKWSKKFNLARGSKASYKFLFRVLFNEQSTDIYLPKDNILRGSDGIYIYDENKIYITVPSDLSKFEFQRIFQKREVYQDIFEYAYANVERVNVRYLGRYTVLELTVSGIEGEFLAGYPIETNEGGLEWPVPTITDFNLTSGGTGFIQNQRLRLDNFSTFDVERTTEIDDVFDTRITSFLNPLDLIVTVNGSPLTGYEFDGRFLTDDSIVAGDLIKVTFPVYEGYVIAKEVDSNGSIQEIEILDFIVGGDSGVSLTWDNSGTGLVANSISGVSRRLEPYWENTQGFLSSNMYLSDGFYYQNFSYVIKTEQSIDKYKDVVDRVLHPAGNLMFAELNIILLMELILGITDDLVQGTDEENQLLSVIVPKYGIGPNYSFFDKMRLDFTPRTYSMADFSVDGYAQHAIGEVGYTLESEALSLLEGYGSSKIGWMSYHPYANSHVYIKQNYAEEFDSGNTYFESGYAGMTPIEGFIFFDENEFMIYD